MTPKRNIRIDDETWEHAKAVATARGVTVTSLVCQALRDLDHYQVVAIPSLDPTPRSVNQMMMDDDTRAFLGAQTHLLGLMANLAMEAGLRPTPEIIEALSAYTAVAAQIDILPVHEWDQAEATFSEARERFT